jgi:hypothetical protein
MQRVPIMHFAWIDADDIPRARFNLSPVAPRFVRPRVDDANAVLIVSVAREGSRGRGDHGVYSGQRKLMKTNIVAARTTCHAARVSRQSHQKYQLGLPCKVPVRFPRVSTPWSTISGQ